MRIGKFFTSGWMLHESEEDLKSRYQMINIALILSGFAFIFGIVINTISDRLSFVLFESFLLIMNVMLFFLLRKNKEWFESISAVITAQCTLLMVFIIYNSEPTQMKYTWLFTYPIVLLYFQKRSNGVYWFIFLLLMLITAPLQSFIEVKYSLFQVMYISTVLIVVSVIVFFYQFKMNEARDLILEQQEKLLNFNAELEKQVHDKTAELVEVNLLLEQKVKSKIEELIQKDKILTVQSKQAVMGEMISMIAHQWRQPLSTITLQISNLELKRLLGESVKEEEISKTLSEISDTIIYLSETIDDFKTYFHPDKELVEIEVHELLEKAINFVLPRLKDGSAKIVVEKNENIMLKTYMNELLQVILNLLSNAIDVFSELKKIDGQIILNVEGDGESIIINVIDNAKGIDEENLPHIFEPYFSTKGKNGTGLGLYMSQMIIEKQFGGSIEVQTSSTGSTFSVKIPKIVS
ncbi:GHKL domain-containing protein [bacterium]|nr:GHKL domain-containing protein [bacterium]